VSEQGAEDFVWQATVDRGTWSCQVVGTGEYRGVLTVTRVRDGKEILQQEVGLSYGAVFGPDVADVAEWQDLSITAIDSYSESD
jgi:hypothetical protein